MRSRLLTIRGEPPFVCRAGKSGNVEGLDIRVRKKGSESIDCVASADAVSIHNAPCYLLVLMDITERKRSELELVSAIEEVMQDASWFSQTLIGKLANVKSINRPDQAGLTASDLTPRERDVLELICEGCRTRKSRRVSIWRSTPFATMSRRSIPSLACTAAAKPSSGPENAGCLPAGWPPGTESSLQMHYPHRCKRPL